MIDLKIPADRISIGWGVDFGRPGGDETVITGVGASGAKFYLYSTTKQNPMSTTPHKYADVIKAWADGKAVQWAHIPGPTYTDPLAQREPEWHDPISWGSSPSFDPDYLWRVKPEPKKWQKEREAFERGERVQWRSTLLRHAGMEWLDLPLDSSMRVYVGRAFDEPTNEFRIAHKWQDEIDAWGRGEDVQVRDDRGDDSPRPGWVGKAWATIDRALQPHPVWLTSPGREYRIKPKTTKHRVRVALMMYGPGAVVEGAIRIFSRTARSEGDARGVELCDEFVRWLGDWFEVEAPL